MEFCADGWLIWLLAIGSVTPRAALLLSFLAAVICLIVRLITRIGTTSSVAVLVSVGITALARALTLRLFPDLVFTPPLWIALAVFAGSSAHRDEARLPYHTVPILVLVGAVREILANGSLWGVTLLPMELSPAFADGVGGYLIAAVILWCCRLHPPLFRHNGQRVPFAVLGGAVAISAVVALFTTDLPDWVAIWGAVAVCALCFSFLPTTYTSDVFTVLIPLTAWWTRRADNRWLPLLFSVGAVAVVWGLTTIVKYRRLSPTPMRFAGVPSALTVSAILYSVLATTL